MTPGEPWGVTGLGHMMGDWTIFSNYGHVLVCLARNSQARLRDVAAEVGITERAVQKIVRDLQQDGFLVVTKQGRCNRYRINRRKSLRHDLESHCTVGKLLALVTRAGSQNIAEAEAADLTPAEAAPAVETVASPEPEHETPVLQPAEEKKPRKQQSPPDTRQQGSLF